MLNKTKCVFNKKSGFTMLEVMVAFTILSVGILAMVPVSIFIMQMNIHNKNLITARLLTEQKSEELRTIDYENQLLVDDGDTTDLFNFINPDHADTITSNKTTYIVAWNIAEVPSKDIKDVNIAAIWNNVANQPHRIETRAIITRTSR